MALSTVQALSSALRGHRLARGLTQGDLAASAGVSRKFVSDVESGKETIEVGKLMALVSALGLTLDLKPTASLTRGSPADSPPDLEAHLREYLDDEDAE